MLCPLLHLELAHSCPHPTPARPPPPASSNRPAGRSRRAFRRGRSGTSTSPSCCWRAGSCRASGPGPTGSRTAPPCSPGTMHPAHTLLTPCSRPAHTHALLTPCSHPAHSVQAHGPPRHARPVSSAPPPGGPLRASESPCPSRATRVIGSAPALALRWLPSAEALAQSPRATLGATSSLSTHSH
jgi:hypothetical protein